MFITRRQLRNIIRENIVTDTLRQATKSAGGEGAPERDPEEVKNVKVGSAITANMPLWMARKNGLTKQIG